MNYSPALQLSSGHRLPVIGLGTCLGTQRSKLYQTKVAVKLALQAGYRHVDTAKAYGNEREVGEGIKASGVPREEVFITSKLWNTDHKPEDVEPALDTTLKLLGTDYLDLYLIHFPISFNHSDEKYPINPKNQEVYVVDVPIEATWAAMEKLVAKGKVRSIGVSNFTQRKLESLLRNATIPPAVNQIEAHVYLQQQKLIDWCNKKGIVVTAYSPLGHNKLNLPLAIEDPEVCLIANELECEAAQVLISWAVQRGTAVVPKSVTASRIRSNLQVFRLPEHVMQRLSRLEKHRRYNIPTYLHGDIFAEVGEMKRATGLLEGYSRSYVSPAA